MGGIFLKRLLPPLYTRGLLDKPKKICQKRPTRDDSIFKNIPAKHSGSAGMSTGKKEHKGGSSGLQGAGYHDLMVEVDNDAVFSDDKQVAYIIG